MWMRTQFESFPAISDSITARVSQGNVGSQEPSGASFRRPHWNVVQPESGFIHSSNGWKRW